MIRSRILHLPGGNGQCEPVLARWQGTGCVRRERARWVLAAIEVDDDLAVGGRPRDVEVTAGGITAVAAGAIGVDEEQRRFALVEDFEAKCSQRCSRRFSSAHAPHSSTTLLCSRLRRGRPSMLQLDPGTSLLVT